MNASLYEMKNEMLFFQALRSKSENQRDFIIFTVIA